MRLSNIIEFQIATVDNIHRYIGYRESVGPRAVEVSNMQSTCGVRSIRLKLVPPRHSATKNKVTNHETEERKKNSVPINPIINLIYIL